MDSALPRAQVARPDTGHAAPRTSGHGRTDLTRVLDAQLSGSLNTRRTVLRVLDLIRDDLADWAMLVLVEPKAATLDMYGGNDPTFTASTRRAAAWTVLRQVMEGRQHEIVHVDLAADPHAALDGVVPHPRLRDEVAGLRPADLLVTPLSARGTTVGAVLLVVGTDARTAAHRPRPRTDGADRAD